jgi:hypothetical protein
MGCGVAVYFQSARVPFSSSSSSLRHRALSLNLKHNRVSVPHLPDNFFLSVSLGFFFCEVVFCFLCQCLPCRTCQNTQEDEELGGGQGFPEQSAPERDSVYVCVCVRERTTAQGLLSGKKNASQ